MWFLCFQKIHHPGRCNRTIILFRKDTSTISSFLQRYDSWVSLNTNISVSMYIWTRETHEWRLSASRIFFKFRRPVFLIELKITWALPIAALIVTYVQSGIIPSTKGRMKSWIYRKIHMAPNIKRWVWSSYFYYNSSPIRWLFSNHEGATVWKFYSVTARQTK